MTTFTDPPDSKAPLVEIVADPDRRIVVEFVDQGTPDPSDSAPRAADSPSEAIQ